MGRTTLKLDTSGFEELINRFKKLGGDTKPIVEKALEKVGDEITRDTQAAIAKKNLPQKGIYSKGNTERSIVKNPKTTWSGEIASIQVGFDYSKPGAGGFLITGTPRMQPDKELNKMYKRKAYMRHIQEDMIEVVQAEIKERIENGR